MKINRITLGVDESTLNQFDQIVSTEGWDSRQEAIVFLLRQAVARGYISKEKADLIKVGKIVLLLMKFASLLILVKIMLKSS